MADVKLKLKNKPKFPLEAEVISPDNFAGKKAADIKKLVVYHGNEEKTLGDFFEVSGDAGEKADTKIIIDGDCALVKRIGESTTAGEIIVNGNVGMHVGNNMAGGKITVNGNAADWAGAMMKGGELVITGNAGHYVGSAYRGYWQGMLNGIIRVKGNVGNESMLWAKSSKPSNKWPTLFCGGAAEFLAMHSHGATVVVEGDVQRCCGADQAWGTIVVKGKVHNLLPSYKKKGQVNEVTLPNGDKIQGKFIEYSGDHTISKETNGRLYIAA